MNLRRRPAQIAPATASRLVSTDPMAPVDPPGGQPIAAPIAAVINGPIVFTSTLSGEARAISSPNRADTPADRRIHNHALRGARCAVRGARCALRGARCAVRGARCAVRGACNGLANVSRFRTFRDYARLRIITFYTRVRICSRLFCSRLLLTI